MKVEVERVPEEFRPIKLTVLLESQDDANGLMHALSCWENQGACTDPGRARFSAKRVWDKLYLITGKS